MQESAIQNSDNKDFRLALQFKIDSSELSSLCRTIQELIAAETQKGLSAGMIAVLITRVIKYAIDMKFEDKRIEGSEAYVGNDSKSPSLNLFKANLVKGMLITFIEHPNGFPGFFDIVAGIAASGLGIGSIKLTDSGKQVKLSELQKFYPEKTITDKLQIKLMQNLFTPSGFAEFPNIRIGAYSVLAGCALLPFYAATLQVNGKSSGDPQQDLENAARIVEKKFRGDAEPLQKFLAQNLFRVLFEELFTHESTVFSIYNP